MAGLPSKVAPVSTVDTTSPPEIPIQLTVYVSVSPPEKGASAGVTATPSMVVTLSGPGVGCGQGGGSTGPHFGGSGTAGTAASFAASTGAAPITEARAKRAASCGRVAIAH